MRKEAWGEDEEERKKMKDRKEVEKGLKSAQAKDGPSELKYVGRA